MPRESGGSEPGTARLPDNHEEYGAVYDPLPVEDGLPVVEDLDVEITKHVCRVGDGQPLCDETADDDAPVYPFRGMRSQIRAGLEGSCQDCRERLAAIAADEVDGHPVATDGGSDTCASGTERFACPECEHGRLQVSDAVYADCDNCDAAVLRTEVGI